MFQSGGIERDAVAVTQSEGVGALVLENFLNLTSKSVQFGAWAAQTAPNCID